MEINETMLENIVVIGKADNGSSIFDEIEVQEAIMAENKDLYDAHDKITKVYGQLMQNGEIQTMAPTIDVNNGCVKIAGVCKSNAAADASKFTPNEVVEQYALALAKVIPDNLNVEVAFDDGEQMPKMDKLGFTILITRKG